MEIHLRKLVEKDAPFMLEWMQDPSISCYFRFNAASMTENSCKAYIVGTWTDSNSRHYAIADEQDEYLGTISLKEIDEDRKEAEYAISTRKCAHGTGVAVAASLKLFDIAFAELGLDRVFLNVLVENQRANAFYKKIGFRFDYTEENAVEIRGAQKSLNWYSIHKENYLELINNAG